MKILVVNCGSSSLKYQLINMQNKEVIATGKCDRIGVESIQKPVIEYKPISRTGNRRRDGLTKPYGCI